MQDNINTYRIHTGIGSDAPNVLNVKLQQTYDMLEVLSLKLNQTNTYNFYESSYGIVVGRVLANDAFGIPNAKVSIFIEVNDAETIAAKGIYPFKTIRDADANGVRYNLLPDEQISACYQNVGTFPNKRLVLDNNDIIEIFDKYWKYTTVTNEAGDYMLFGIPTGDQQLHVDVDLSDIGVLSQRPRDMIYKGYNAELFESPNKFKQSRNLDSLSQIFSQNKGVYVYPYWGDTSNTEETIAITRCDIQLEYKFEPTCVFMGCIITDQGENAIGKNCAAVENNGRMRNLIAGEGSIEMIRKTIDGKVEEYQIKGNRLIDSNGVWCYQIPMNLDYVRTDEYGNIVPTDDPNKGIPTRTRVRFRISLDETPNDAEARKRCRFLVPNNPTMDERDYPIFNSTKEFDYDFGTTTRDEDYKDLFWNKVYTVKSYIPRLQKGSKENNKKHTGIKAVNFFENNNPFPYNNLLIKLSFNYKIICILVKFILYFVMTLNIVFSVITNALYLPYAAIKGISDTLKSLPWPIDLILSPITAILDIISGLLDALMIECIGFGTEFCDDGINKVKYFFGCTRPFACEKTLEDHNNKQASLPASERERGICLGISDIGEIDDTPLFTCVEQQLAQDNDCVNFNFHNDWINGALYAPLWYRRITPKKTFLFGLFRKKAKDQWCSADRSSGGTKLFQPCAIKRNKNGEFVNNDGDKEDIMASTNDGCGNGCISSSASIPIANGVIKTKETMYGQTVYYYQAGEYQQNLNNNKGEILTLFATDIVLLGSLNDCDINGIPQFFKNLTSTTYNMPNNILVIDGDVKWNVDENGNMYEESYSSTTEATGCDWGNTNKSDEYRENNDGGLFYGIGCLKSDSKIKSCINLSRICEYGVVLDETKFIENITDESSETDNSEYVENLLIPDGYISYDELMNIDERSMFATLNGNHLRTKLNKKTGLYEYDLRHYYVDNFDGILADDMNALSSAPSNITYRYNSRLELLSKDYYHFRMGDRPFYYDRENRLPKYDNSFYFYFGIKPGSTAIEKFNSQFFSNCENTDEAKTAISIEAVSNSWCGERNDGYIKLDLTGISTPYELTITNKENNSMSHTITNESNEKIYFSAIDKSFDDYKFIQIYYNENKNIYEMPNGTYDILIVDGDGIENEFDVSMNEKYITFNTFVQNFEVTNNVLLSEHNNSFCEIAEETLNNVQFVTVVENETQVTLKEVTSEIGGTISVFDIYSNNESVGDDIRITVESKNAFLYNEDSTNEDEQYKKWSVSYDINGDNIQTNYTNGICANSTTTIKKLEYGYEDKDGNTLYLPYYVIGVPRGNEDYIISVTQLCDGVDTKNTSTTTVTIEEPKPFKLYINNIDYDIIQDFASGYNINGIEAVPNGKEPVQWLNISDKNNYNWGANELYTVKHYTDMGLSKEDATKEVEKLQNELIETMRSKFMLRCQGAPFTLSFSVETDDMPYTLYVGYKEEEDGGNDYEHNVITECANIVEETLSISDIQIPTITSINNDIYGNNSYPIPNNTDKCYAVEPSSRCVKSPYYVAVINSRGNTIPRSGITISGDSENGYELVEDNLVNYFAIHIIDKIMQLNVIAWSYMDGIPYYKPTNNKMVGKTFTRKGLLAGILYNGISTSESVDAQFTEQTLGSDDLEIETYTIKDGSPDEDAIPTKRVIKGKHEEDGKEEEDIEYSKYQIDNTITSLTYASVDKKDLELTIQDEMCEITEDIYGKMSIVVSTENTIIDSRNKNNLVLSVDARNDGAETTYYAIPFNNEHGYIINKLGANAITQYADYGYMKHDFTDFRGLSQKIDPRESSLGSEHPLDDDSENMIYEKGWGTTGIFTLYSSMFDGDKMLIQPYFIIAVSGVTRCISPVYELYFYGAKLTLTKRYKNNTPTNEIIYELLLEITGAGDSYYMNNYSYTVNVRSNLTIDEVKIEMNYDFQKEYTDNEDERFKFSNLDEEDNYTIESDFESLYDNLEEMTNTDRYPNPPYPEGYGLNLVASQVTVTITDHLGLHHICDLTSIELIDNTL